LIINGERVYWSMVSVLVLGIRNHACERTVLMHMRIEQFLPVHYGLLV